MPETIYSSPGWLAIFQSPIGKKILTGVTGLGMVGFVVIHVLGNCLLLFSADAYNLYAYGLERLSPLVWTVEGLLVLAVGIHASLGLQIYLNSRKARPVDYAVYQSAGSPSQQTLSSRTMIFSGGLLAIFLVWHLATFKFGHYYSTSIDGTEMRDLSSLVIETFQQPISPDKDLRVKEPFLRFRLFQRQCEWSFVQFTLIKFPVRKYPHQLLKY